MDHKFFIQRHLRFFAYLRMLHCYVRNFLKDCKLKIDDEDEIFKVIILYHYNKMFSNSKAAYRLLKYGFSNEVDILIRSFIDSYVNINFIAKNPKIRSLQYRLDELYFYRDSRINLKTFDEKYDKSILNKQIEETAQQIKEIKNKLKVFDPQKDYSRFRWKNISIETKFKELGMQKEYIYIFLHFSGSVHPGSTKASNYLNFENQIFKSIINPIYDDSVRHKLMLFSEYLLDLSFLAHNYVTTDLIHYHFHRCKNLPVIFSF